MPLTGVDNVISILTENTAGQQEIVFFNKDGYRSGTTSTMPSFANPGSTWIATGQRPVYGNIPGAASIPTRATTGALGQANATGGRTKYITGYGLAARGTGPVFLADRLAHMGGLDGTSIVAQTVATTAGRYTSATEAVGNEIWAEIYDTIGASSRTITASYSNENGTPGRTTVPRSIGSAAGGANQIGRMFRLPLQQGDLGVTYVDTITLSASTGTAGNFGITIAKTLCSIGRSLTNGGLSRDYVFSQFTPIPIKEDACLYFWDEFSPSSGAEVFSGYVQFIEA